MMKIAMQVFRHRLTFIICSRLSASAAGMLVGISLARALGPAGLGEYANLVATAGIAGTLLCLGMEIPYNLQAAKNPGAGGNLLLMTTVQSACAIPAAGAIWLLLALLGQAPVAPLFLFALLTAAFVLNQLAQPVMSGLQKQVWVNIAMAGLLLTQAAAVMILHVYAIAPLMTAVMINVATLSILGLLAFASRFNDRSRAFPYRRTVSDIFAQGRHYLLATVGGIIRLRAGIVVMGWSLPPHDLGNYQIMQTLTEVLYLVPVTVSTYILSLRSEGAALRRETFSAASASVAMTLICAGCISAALPFLVPIVYGAGFEKVIEYGPLMLSGAVAFSVGKGVSAYFSRLGLVRLVARVEIASTVIAVCALVILIPEAGLKGAVWAFVAASWCSAGIYVVQLIRHRRGAAPFTRPIKGGEA